MAMRGEWSRVVGPIHASGVFRDRCAGCGNKPPVLERSPRRISLLHTSECANTGAATPKSTRRLKHKRAGPWPQSMEHHWVDSPVEEAVFPHGLPVLEPDAANTQQDPETRQLHVPHPQRDRGALQHLRCEHAPSTRGGRKGGGEGGREGGAVWIARFYY